MSEVFDDVSDQDFIDKLWCFYYNYKFKKKFRQLKKMRKVNWRKEYGNRSLSYKCKYLVELDCVVGKVFQDKFFEEEEIKEMFKLQCEFCDGDKVVGVGN